MTEIARRLRNLIDGTRGQLLAIPEARASARPGAAKWSPKEILGHCIDSATNNHQRIVRMQQAADIGTLTYDQERWVSAQHYRDEPWESIVDFWHRYNLHLAHVIQNVDPATLGHVCDMGHSEPATLKFVIEDYVRHVEHHLGQILSGVDPAGRKK